MSATDVKLSPSKNFIMTVMRIQNPHRQQQAFFRNFPGAKVIDIPKNREKEAVGCWKGHNVLMILNKDGSLEFQQEQAK